MIASHYRRVCVQVNVTGALGMRTVHQVDPKAQLVAHVRQCQQGDTTLATAATSPSLMGADADISTLGFDEVGLTKELEGMQDDSAVYVAPKLLEPSSSEAQQPSRPAGSTDATNETAEGSSDDAGGTTPGVAVVGQAGQLTGMEQALLLGWASHVKKGTAQDELQQWQMAPYVEAVLQQTQTQYMLQVLSEKWLQATWTCHVADNSLLPDVQCHNHHNDTCATHCSSRSATCALMVHMVKDAITS